jgi:hypothetical protein
VRHEQVGVLEDVGLERRSSVLGHLLGDVAVLPRPEPAAIISDAAIAALVVQDLDAEDVPDPA